MSDTLLPWNATNAERALEGATARVSDVPVLVREHWDPDTCPAAALPWLAWAFSVDEWDFNWSEAQKRQVIRASVEVHRRKGTPAGLQAALDALGHAITITEWHKLTPLGDPYTFGLTVEILDEGIPDAAGFDRIVAVANEAKNVRSHMAFLNITSTRRGRIYWGAKSFSGETVGVRGQAENITDYDLWDDACANGIASTEAGVDALHLLVNTTLPAPGYW